MAGQDIWWQTALRPKQPKKSCKASLKKRFMWALHAGGADMLMFLARRQ